MDGWKVDGGWMEGGLKEDEKRMEDGCMEDGWRINGRWMADR